MGEAGRTVDVAFRALADANRRRILALVKAPLTVGQVADRAELSQQTASHHLRVLRQAGLVTESREGTRHLYAVQTDGFAAVRSYLDDFWPSQLAALKLAVESNAADDHG